MSHAEASAAIQRVRDLHKPDEDGYCNECGRLYGCGCCGPRDRSYVYPCPTIKALDGEQE